MDILMEIIYEPRKNMGLNGFILPTNKCDYTEFIEITKNVDEMGEALPRGVPRSTFPLA